MRTHKKRANHMKTYILNLLVPEFVPESSNHSCQSFHSKYSSQSLDLQGLWTVRYSPCHCSVSLFSRIIIFLITSHAFWMSAEVSTTGRKNCIATYNFFSPLIVFFTVHFCHMDNGHHLDIVTTDKLLNIM